MKSKRRVAVAATGVAAVAGLLLMTPGQASARVYYTVKNSSEEVVDYTLFTYQDEVLQPENRMTLQPGETREWLNTRDDYSLDRLEVAWHIPSRNCGDMYEVDTSNGLDYTAVVPNATLIAQVCGG